VRGVTGIGLTRGCQGKGGELLRDRESQGVSRVVGA
jgi:hypothetical protein